MTEGAGAGAGAGSGNSFLMLTTLSVSCCVYCCVCSPPLALVVPLLSGRDAEALGRLTEDDLRFLFA